MKREILDVNSSSISDILKNLWSENLIFKKDHSTWMFPTKNTVKTQFSFKKPIKVKGGESGK